MLFKLYIYIEAFAANFSPSVSGEENILVIETSESTPGSGSELAEVPGRRQCAGTPTVQLTRFCGINDMEAAANPADEALSTEVSSDPAGEASVDIYSEVGAVSNGRSGSYVNKYNSTTSI